MTYSKLNPKSWGRWMLEEAQCSRTPELVFFQSRLSVCIRSETTSCKKANQRKSPLSSTLLKEVLDRSDQWIETVVPLEVQAEQPCCSNLKKGLTLRENKFVFSRPEPPNLYLGSSSPNSAVQSWSTFFIESIKIVIILLNDCSPKIIIHSFNSRTRSMS